MTVRTFLSVACFIIKSLNRINVTLCGCADLKDMSVMVLRTRGPAKLPKGYKLTMHISQGDAESIRVFRSRSTEGTSNSLCE